MLINFARNKSALRKATLAIVAFSFFQASVSAQSPGQTNETIVIGETSLIGLARGDELRYSAFNPLKTESGLPNETIRLQITLFLPDGTPLRSAEVEIPPGEFRSIAFPRNELPIAGEPGTARAQIRTTALWGVRSRYRFVVSASLELVDETTGQTTDVKYYAITLNSGR